MRAAIITDIHANLAGLRVVLDRIADLRADTILCLGDVVGYNPWPNECVSIIRDMSIRCVMGNHDRVAAGLQEPDHFNAMAREAILWTRHVLSDEHREFLSRLPDRIAFDESTILVHGSPRDPDEYILTTSCARENTQFMEERLGTSVCFFGHTHVTGVFDRAQDGWIDTDEGVVLRSGNAYLVNPGSVGQPRDGDPRSSFLVYDTEGRAARFYRIPYDIGSVQEAIAQEGLPAHLGQRLFLGR